MGAATCLLWVAMKTRLLVALVLSAFGIALAVSPAVAQKPIPGIKQTAAWKSLQSYVSLLQTRRDTPAAPAARSRYVQNLAKRRDNAETRVHALYGMKLMRIASQDDRWQRREIKGIRRGQKRQVQALKDAQADRVSVLQSKQAVATRNVQDRYARRISPLADRRDKLRRKLVKTSNPDKRATLNRKIQRLQNRINDLSDAQNDEISAINDRYGTRISAVNSLFNARISNVKTKAKRQITRVNRAWKKTFRTQVKAAKVRRDSQRGLVKTLARRGAGYINRMPEPPPAP